MLITYKYIEEGSNPKRSNPDPKCVVFHIFTNRKIHRLTDDTAGNSIFQLVVA